MRLTADKSNVIQSVNITSRRSENIIVVGQQCRPPGQYASPRPTLLPNHAMTRVVQPTVTLSPRPAVLKHCFHAMVKPVDSLIARHASCGVATRVENAQRTGATKGTR
jgi:hypothetical protein